jgi:hypothetical protein
MVSGRICLNLKLDKYLNEVFEKQLSTSNNCLITSLNLVTLARWNLLVAGGDVRVRLSCPSQLQTIGSVACSSREFRRSSNISNKKICNIMSEDGC